MNPLLSALPEDEHAFVVRDFLLKYIDQSKKCLEIGAFYRPFFDHQQENIVNIDVFSKEALELVKKNTPTINNNEKVIDVDYLVDPLKKYNDYIPHQFDYIFSSHNVEHQPCLITHLNNVESVLKDDGIAMFYIPDKNYCFDHFLNESTIVDVLTAFYEKRVVPDLRARLNSGVLNTHNMPMSHWLNYHKKESNWNHHYQKSLTKLINKSRQELEREFIKDDDMYIDVHCFQYTPQGFRDIMTVLNQKEYTNLNVFRIYETYVYSNEFLAVLIKDPV